LAATISVARSHAAVSWEQRTTVRVLTPTGHNRDHQQVLFVLCDGLVETAGR
jgi:hypothetical protein